MVTANSPFSPRRARDDVLNALPAIGMVVGAVVGVLLGALQGVGGPVSLGGLSIVVGLLLGVVGRALFGPDRS